MRALLVANPAATTTNRRVRDVMVGALASTLKVDLAETTRRGHAREFGVQATTDGYDLVVALGGDGTVNEVVNGMLDGGPGPHVPTLAVVPGGSTNVFSRALGRSRDPVEAVGEILESWRAGRVRRVSLGTAAARTPDEPDRWTPHRWFVFTAGMGFDADVIARIEEQRARGRRSTGALYVQTGTRTFLTSRDRRHPPIRLEVPGEAPVDGLFLCLVSNVSPWTYLGSRPIDPSPHASFETGLDVFALQRTGSLRMIDHLRRAMSAQPDVRGRGVHRWHDLPDLTLACSRPQRWELDGDHLGEAVGLRLRHVAAALDVVA
ncbi:diacylglycerol kinase family lipid kinase [Modestobacter sp. I12A-02628]|uniref:Diacylglycerol kinase family lipid kinase n=1 Tax=Goekera deserti TaxID=2497753 RepID=A0A7K3W810_9ACTN|nr:diacylglycerol kinase family protein [Goekera deserti]MPQ99899.1 diacylglycerol kinase family lipid kinase [Goekera deserti]NDI50058.1 diacylglycerol kinase family lipid kinase [Goekera deserti]NEL52466.1 diacylglycerol kinase family lipid kinase [Goekera deserti]